MTTATVYIAGPDVFKRDANEIYGAYASKCVQKGVKCLYPNDETIAPADTRESFAQNIYSANIKMMEECDVVIANVEPFRGPSMDVGAAFEIGHAKALGKPIVAFSPHPPTTYFQRLKDYYKEIEPGDLGFRSKDEGILLEDSGLNENLMIAKALDVPMQIGFDAALQEALRIYSEKQTQSISHEHPEDDFPIWLETFDSSNNQHECSLDLLDRFLSKLRPEVPQSWLDRKSLDVLDLACGDGRFSRNMIGVIERNLAKPINYAAADINPQFVASAKNYFPKGFIREGNIFEELFDLSPANFANNLVVLSHAVYFALDKYALVQRLAELGNADSLTLILLNDPIYRPVSKDVDALIDALEKAELPYVRSKPFASYVFMPVNADTHIKHLIANPDEPHPDEKFEKTKRLLFFFQQSPLAQLPADVREQFLNTVLNDLEKQDGKIAVQNHWIAILRKDSSQAFRASVRSAMSYMYY